MAEIVKAAWLPSGSYLAREDRMVIRALRTWEGIVDQDDMKVSATTTPSMQVTVAPGRAIIDGDQDPSAQGSYIVAPPDTVTLTHDAADPTNPRIDLVGAQVWDNDFDGSGNYTWARTIIKGTPAPAPVVPAQPTNFLPLAQVTVGAAVASITSDKISDVRNRTGHKPFQMEVVEQGAVTTLFSGQATAIRLNTIQRDVTGLMWDTPAFRCRIVVSGTYSIVGQVTRAWDSNGNWLAVQIAVARPSVGTYQVFAEDGGYTSHNYAGRKNVTWCGFLEKDCYVQLWGYSEQPQNNGTDHNAVLPFLAVELLD